MSLALPGVRGLFSHLQHAITSRRGTRLRLTPPFQYALDNFRWLLLHLGERPTRLQELVPTAPSVVGTHDASGAGAGGVWLLHASALPRAQSFLVLAPGDHITRLVQPSSPVPVVWRTPLAPDITRRLVSFTNPAGDLNNSQFELLGAFLQDAVAANCWDIRERTIQSGTDNVATLY